jgi:hypothetical protein
MSKLVHQITISSILLCLTHCVQLFTVFSKILCPHWFLIYFPSLVDRSYHVSLCVALYYVLKLCLQKIRFLRFSFDNLCSALLEIYTQCHMILDLNTFSGLLLIFCLFLFKQVLMLIQWKPIIHHSMKQRLNRI